MIDALASDNPNGVHDELISVFAEFQKEDRNGLHMAALHTRQFLVQEELIAYEDLSFENLTWEHINIWGFPYQLKAGSVDVSHIIVRQGERYIRCFRPVFRSLMHQAPLSPVIEWRPVGNRFWGFPHMLEVQEEYTYSRLFFQQAVYDHAEDAIRDMRDERKIDLSVAFDEIFGDG